MSNLHTVQEIQSIEALKRFLELRFPTATDWCAVWDEWVECIETPLEEQNEYVQFSRLIRDKFGNEGLFVVLEHMTSIGVFVEE